MDNSNFENLSSSHFSPSHFHRPDVVDSPLYCITPIFNPKRYRSRWKLYKDFENYVLSNNEARLITIECSFGEREKVITQHVSEKHTAIHVSTPHEIWIKENLINLAMQRLPSDWKYVAWIDADIQFTRPDWVGETIQKLQHHDVIQMFSEAVDLSPDFEILRRFKGYCWCLQNEDKVPSFYKKKGHYTPEEKNVGFWHPGFAWAARKTAINNLGGLIDWCILGGGDLFMAYCLAERLDKRTMPGSLGRIGIRWLKEWQERCKKYIRKNIGYMDGTVMHYWHGKKINRRYRDRGQILTSAKFNPELDLKRDWQGLYQLTDRSSELRDQIRKYFSQRNEDSIDVE